MEIKNESEVKDFLDKIQGVFEKMSKTDVRQVLDGSSMRFELFVKGKKLCSCDDYDSVREIESALRAQAKLMSLVLTSMTFNNRSADEHVE